MGNVIYKELQDINPYVRVCRCTKTHPDWSLIDRIIYDHQLVLVVKGCGQTVIDGKNYKSSIGNLYLIKPGVVHSFIACSENPFDMLVIHFDFFYERERNFWPHKKFHLDEGGEIPEKHLLRDIPSFNGLIFPDCFFLKNFSAVEVLMKKMIEIFESEAAGRELLLKAYLLEIIHMMYFAAQEYKPDSSMYADFKKIKNSLDYINENYMCKISVHDLAALCNLSTNYFAGLFKQQTGYSPMEYVIRVRIENAKQLLSKSENTVSEVQEKVGFNDLHYFSYYFKKIEGLSPSQYRQSVHSQSN